MEPPIYSYPLCIAPPLMSFFGFYFLLTPTPEKVIFDSYPRSRQIMGVATLLLAANYSIHFFFGIRFENIDAVIPVNPSTYFLYYWLLSSVLTTLLGRLYITECRLRTHICLWILFSILSDVVPLLLPRSGLQIAVMFTLATWLVICRLLLIRRLLRAYHRVIHILDDTRADDIGTYIGWLSTFTYQAVTFEVGCELLTFLPDEYIYIRILSPIPFYIYLFLCYLSYLLSYEQMENTMEDGMIPEEEDLCNTTNWEQAQRRSTPPLHAEMARRIKGWTDADGYIRSGLTIKELSDMLHTNHAYLSAYTKIMHKMIFREWITGLRLEHAKNILKGHPEINIQKLAEPSGFLSRSNFIKSFTKKEGCTPGKWKKANLE